MAHLRCEDSDKNRVLFLLGRSIQLESNADALYERANLYFEMQDYAKALEVGCLSISCYFTFPFKRQCNWHDQKFGFGVQLDKFL